MSSWDHFWEDHKTSKAEAWIASERARILDGCLDRLKAGRKNVLEVGCGSANNLRRIQKTRPDAECYALDNSPVAIEKARGEISRAVVGDCVKTPYEDKKFDLVYSAGVMEHLGDEAPFIREMSRILADDGLLVTFVPARYSLWRLYQLLLWRFLGHEYEKSYTRGELVPLFGRNGFETEEFVGLDPFSVQGALMKVFNVSFDPPVKKTPFPSAYTEVCIITRKAGRAGA